MHSTSAPSKRARCAGVEPARLDGAVVESFAATSSALPVPPVGVYLRGVAEAPDPAETHLAWRWDVADLAALGADAATRVLAFYRPGAQELARVPTSFAEGLVARALERRAGRALPMVVAGPGGEVFAAPVEDAAALPSLAHATVLLPPDAGGLTPSGLPDPEAGVEVADVADDEHRVRYVDCTRACVDMAARNIALIENNDEPDDEWWRMEPTADDLSGWLFYEQRWTTVLAMARRMAARSRTKPELWAEWARRRERELAHYRKDEG